MFYYPNVLQRHTGCFSTIWLAATRGSRLVKREYLKVNIAKTCEEILNYVLVRVQPPMPGLPRPRFSLYLSAQLQIGVIRVYYQQCQYLVEDIQHILEHLHRAQLRIRIDMEEADLPSLLLPNCLTMMETLEDAPEPFFGTMSVDPRLPSPFDIPQIRHLLEAVTPKKTGKETPPEVTAEPESKEEPRALEGDGVVPSLSPPAPAQVEGIREPLPGQAFPPEVQKLTGWEPGALLTELSLEAAEEEKSRTSLIPAEERWAVALELQANRVPDFSSLVPPLSHRKLASRVFYLLLVLSAQKILRVEQEKPYGRLLIHLGPRVH
ncbi:hypothetical protein STEG23_007630 [Scotinomys teguina]